MKGLGILADAISQIWQCPYLSNLESHGHLTVNQKQDRPDEEHVSQFPIRLYSPHYKDFLPCICFMGAVAGEGAQWYWAAVTGLDTLSSVLPPPQIHVHVFNRYINLSQTPTIFIAEAWGNSKECLQHSVWISLYVAFIRHSRHTFLL